VTASFSPSSALADSASPANTATGSVTSTGVQF
jgi:hypothetical protein